MIKSFEEFCKNAEIGEKLIQKIQNNEDYSNYFNTVLETVRRTLKDWNSCSGIVVQRLLE